MSDLSYLTAEGAARLRKELQELKGPARLALSKRLRAAIQQGDLSENADYIAAKEEQGFLEGRILELENTLHNVVIIDESTHSKDAIEIGSRITVQEDDFPPDTYYLVGPKEANPEKGNISYESPIGRALLGHKVKDVVEIETPAGALRLKVTKIE
ncbi:MAG: transcription elongation factor GreA [Anaerolineaceae bacterium]|jgi:transcription elongation factor GreA